ncbi:MAG: hypothetical protein E2P02_01550 [Acidobacteria bacterium]|nr:MAG: hypothetical protein E2P02_01550 [Acidobacteriota bacterium]
MARALARAYVRAIFKLRARNERLSRTVECRFFAGLSEQETAEALGVSLRTAQRNWMRTRAWIRSELSGRRASKTAENRGQTDLTTKRKR